VDWVYDFALPPLVLHAPFDRTAAPLRRWLRMTADTSSGFPGDERRLLLSLPRIGPRVVERIEAQGIASLADLQRRGVDRVIDEICRQMGSLAWGNRRSALVEALGALARASVAGAKQAAERLPKTVHPRRPDFRMLLQSKERPST
jgi:hypothetical protein